MSSGGGFSLDIKRMTVSKTWAYLHEFGPERTTAWAIRQERAKYGGKPLGKTYWSNHKPGQRKPVKQVQTAEATFFAYINASDAEGGGGESLSHRLLKEAIAGLSGTRLKLGSHGEHDITITHGETEKAIATEDATFYADVFLQFTSTSSIGLRWSGEVFIEVKHTHAVPVDKQRALQRLRVPVVEVPLLATFEYPYNDEDTSDPRELAHVERIRNMLQKGFLMGQVISDARSAEFLEQEVSRLQKELQEARTGWDSAKRAGAESQSRLQATVARAVELERLNTNSAQRMEVIASSAETGQRDLETERARSRALKDELLKAKAIVAAQEKKIHGHYWIVGLGFCCLLGLGSVVGYRQLVAGRTTGQTIPTESIEVSPAPQPPSMAAKGEKRDTAPNQRRRARQASAMDRTEMDHFPR